MRKIREVLRLSAAGRSQRLIAQSIGVGQGTVGDYLNRARLAGVVWPTEMDAAALERALYPPRPPVAAECRPVSEWPTLHRELKRKGVTLFREGQPVTNSRTNFHTPRQFRSSDYSRAACCVPIFGVDRMLR